VPPKPDPEIGRFVAATEKVLEAAVTPRFTSTVPEPNQAVSEPLFRKPGAPPPVASVGAVPPISVYVAPRPTSAFRRRRGS
jgi:hypothetical protein